ncbi:hypothetical protein PGTUg99_034594 [Puccinia graminis f. sp. tritici]|uniref:Uncharacterized protein n=1 Tax=Puccinia graminis f. sp. tritici TaxID=56615 RepID=A0A5B0SMZ9_PUCGR|nr:hypothetical protein PGTUg99_034594 [Puccinia graminis f. sp. tritici]
MPKAKSYRHNGDHASSTRTRNKHLKLPAYNSPLCQALYDFIRLLLGIRNNSDPCPSPPSVAQLAQLNREWYLTTSDEITKTTISKIANELTPIDSPTPLHGKKKVLHESHRIIFIRHLQIIKFPHECFNWNEPCSSAWNEEFTELIRKHWNHARASGAFLAYSMDPCAACDSSIITALIHRWFNGRRDEIHREERNPGYFEKKKKLIQRSHWRKTLSEHRSDTLKLLNVPSKFHGIFEDPLCNSDTEMDDTDSTLVKVKLAWRSPVAQALATRVNQLTIQRKEEGNKKVFGPAQLLETRRQISKKTQQAITQPKVPRCQPSDFYDEHYLLGLGKSAQEELCVEPPVGLSDLWFHLNRSLVSDYLTI